MYINMRLLKSVKSLVHSLIDRFELVIQPGYFTSPQHLEYVWRQVRHIVFSYPSVFPMEVVPEIMTQYVEAKHVLEKAKQSENPLMWFVEAMKPLCDYLDNVAYSRRTLSAI